MIKKNQLWIPKGFGHGYLVMSNAADIINKCTEKYYPNNQKGVKWNDPFFNIRWPMMPKVLTQKDSSYPNFSHIFAALPSSDGFDPPS